MRREVGFVVLDTAARKLEPEFVPFSTRQLHRVKVDITGASTNSAVYQKMKKSRTADLGKRYGEFILTGAADPSARIAKKYLYNLAKDDFFFIKIKDETKLVLDPKDYEKDVSLKGEFVRLVMASDASEEDKVKIIRTGLEALTGEEVTV